MTKNVTPVTVALVNDYELVLVGESGEVDPGSRVLRPM